MKLRVLKPYLLARSNGGEISMLEFLSYFVQKGWDVKVWIAAHSGIKDWAKQFLSQFDVVFEEDGYRISDVKCELYFKDNFHPTELASQGFMEDFFVSQLKRDAPDVVWAHYTDFFSCTSAIKWNASRSWVFQTDNEYPRLDRLKEFSTIYPFYQKISKFLVGSTFLKQSCEASFPGARAFCLPRLIDGFKIHRLQRTSEYWLFVNPVKVKGVEFLLKLAKRMPSEKFLIVGNWEENPPEDLPSNIRYIPKQKSLHEVFKGAKALLMPSVWEEAFGRIAIEAMSVGIPVVASDRGALPETIGEAGYCLPLDIDQWILSMGELSDREEKLIERGFERVRAHQKDALEALDKYQQLVQIDASQNL